MKPQNLLINKKTIRGIYLIFLLVISSFVALGLVFTGDFSHDEHQFVAAGELLAKYRLLPYIDYPYHHTPNLVFLYALVFPFSSYSLLPARLVSAVFLIISSILLANLTEELLGRDSRWSSKALALGVSMVFLFNPLTQDTGSRAWNHDFPLTLSLLMTWIILKVDEKKYSSRLIFSSALTLGIAVGSRLSYAMLVLPYLLYLLFMLKQRSQLQSRAIRTSLIAILSGLAPLIGLSILAPNRSLFSNFTYPRLSHTYFTLVTNPVAMDFPGKISFLYQILLANPGLGVLVLTLIYSVILFMIYYLKQSLSLRAVSLFMLAILAAILLGSLAPTPTWFHYFYPTIPFALLAIISIIKALPQQGYLKYSPIIIGLLISLIFNLRSSTIREYAKGFAKPKSGVPMKIHNLGESLTKVASSGKILTLAPIIPLEADLEIYPAFATGPFTWRVAGLLTEAKRSQYGLVSLNELNQYLEHDKPAGILTGFEHDKPGLTYLDKGGLERPFDEYAETFGYIPETLGKYQDSILTIWTLPDE